MAELLYEGKAKQVYKTEKEDEYLIHYKDDATAGNGVKHDKFEGKGVLNNTISCILTYRWTLREFYTVKSKAYSYAFYVYASTLLYSLGF